jgi:hypothetical protein
MGNAEHWLQTMRQFAATKYYCERQTDNKQRQHNSHNSTVPLAGLHPSVVKPPLSRHVSMTYVQAPSTHDSIVHELPSSQDVSEYTHTKSLQRPLVHASCPAAQSPLVLQGSSPMQNPSVPQIPDPPTSTRRMLDTASMRQVAQHVPKRVKRQACRWKVYMVSTAKPGQATSFTVSEVVYLHRRFRSALDRTHSQQQVQERRPRVWRWRCTRGLANRPKIRSGLRREFLHERRQDTTAPGSKPRKALQYAIVSSVLFPSYNAPYNLYSKAQVRGRKLT